MGLVPHKKRRRGGTRLLSLSPPYEDTVKGRHLQARKRAFTWNPVCQPFDLGLVALEQGEISVCC